jgi:hypothetical protein
VIEDTMSLVNRRKNIEREERQVARGQREDAAGKLAQRVPDLASLSLAIQETRPDGVASNTQYIRRVVVDQAPALFELPCSYSYCTDGGYDLTREIIDALSSRMARFEGERACRGSCGSEYCSRVLRYVATATYR